MPRRSTVIIAATLALLSAFEPVWCLAEASPEADGKADVERPRFLKREIKRYTFSNATSITRPFEVRPVENQKSSSTSSSLTSSLDALLTSSSASSTHGVTTSSSVPSTTPPSVASSTQSPPSTPPKSSPALSISLSVSISLPTIPSVEPSISIPSLSLTIPSNPISTPILPSISSTSTSRFASPPGDSSTSSPKGQETSTPPAVSVPTSSSEGQETSTLPVSIPTSSPKGQETSTPPAVSTPISSPKNSAAQESTPKPSDTSDGGVQGSSSDNGDLPLTSDLTKVLSTPATTFAGTTRFQPPPSSKPAGQNSSPSTDGGQEETPSNGGQTSEDSKPTSTEDGGESIVNSVIESVTKGPSITAGVSISDTVPSITTSVVGGSNTGSPAESLPATGTGKSDGSSGPAGSEPTDFSEIPNKPTSGNGASSASLTSSENSLYNALTSALQTGTPTPVASTVLSDGQTVPVSGIASETAPLSSGSDTQPSGSAVVSEGTVPESITSSGQVISNPAFTDSISQSAFTSDLVPASITVSGSVIPNTASIPVITGGVSGLSTLSDGQVVSSYGPSTLTDGGVIPPGLSTLPSGLPVSVTGLPLSTGEVTAEPTGASTGGPTVLPTIVPTGSNGVNTGVVNTEFSGASSIAPTGVLPGSISDTGAFTGGSSVNTGVPNTEVSGAPSTLATGVLPGSLSGSGAPQTSGGLSQETTLPTVSSNPSGSSAPVIVGSTTNSKGDVVPITSVPISSQLSASTGVASPASGQSATASPGGSTTLSNGSVVPISALSKATESTGAGSAASVTGATATGASAASAATGVTNSLANETSGSPSSGGASVPATTPASAASDATPATSVPLSQSGAPPSSNLPIATAPQSFDTSKGGPFSLTPTGYDSQTVASVPSSIIYAPSSSSPTASNDFGPTGLPSGVPLILYPPGGAVRQPPNTELIQIGFKYPLNYDFVWTHQESQDQIFKYLPMGVAYGLGIMVENCTMQTLRAWDTTQDLHYITTLALAWIPKDLVNNLGVIIKTPSTPFYNNPNLSVRTLISMINPAIDIHADDQTDGGSSTVGATPSGTGTSTNGGAPISNPNNAPVRKSSVGIGVGVVCGAAAYGAAMFFVARRYKKRRRSHMRSPSMFSSPVMSHAGPDPAAGTALMSGGMGGERSLSPYYDNDGRGSRGSGRSGSSAGRQQISAPVMAENSLGWN